MNNLKDVKNKISSNRLLTLYIIIGLIFVIYIGRLFTIQILEGQSYSDQADENRITKVSEATTRGSIYDRNGSVLASNVASYNVTITPAYLPSDEGETQNIYRQLSALINVPVSSGETDEQSVRLFKECESDLGITQIVYIGNTNHPYEPVKIKCNIDQNVAMIIEGKLSDWPGVDVQVDPIRNYPTGSLTSEIIGFLGPIPAAYQQQYVDEGFVLNRDKVGYAGVESSLQDILGGKNGQRMVEVDVAGKEIRDVETPVDPVSGTNIQLTIDTRLQLAAKTALVNEINYWNTYLNTVRSENGVVIAMNPKTGEILSLVSYPTYENNRMARVIPSYYYTQLMNDPNRPLFNHAISAEHPPGSVFKIAAAIGALNEGVVTPEQTINDPGKITITEKYYPNDPGSPRDYVCWQHTGHGSVDFVHGVAWSCDVYFYKIGGGYGTEVPNSGLGILRLAEYAKALGFNRTTGIELPGESKGLIPTPAWKRVSIGENWSTGDTYIATIGQGYVLSTPLQLLMSYATVANDGKMMQPTLLKSELDKNGNVTKTYQPKQVWDITKDNLITVYNEDGIETGEKKNVQPWVIQKLKEGLRMVVTEGTAKAVFADLTIPSAGKTGTAEYCDNVAQAKNICTPGNWPSHAWYAGYAPYDDPEIVVMAFVYNGGEGASVAAPIVDEVMKAYFNLKAIDNAKTTP
jgi:penicillin-binding protein 2